MSDVSTLIDDLNREQWSKRLQKVYYTENSAVFLAGTDAAATLSSDGRKFHKPILSHVEDEAYTPGTDISAAQIESADEELAVDQMRSASAYVDDISAKQNYYGALSQVAQGIVSKLNNRIEQHFLSKVSDADNSHSVGAMSTSNSIDTVNSCHALLDSNDIPQTDRVMVVGPRTLGVFRETFYNRATVVGDTVLKNGVVNTTLGVPFVVNNNLPFSYTVDLSTNPTANDTVVVNGVTYTFVASPTLAGHVDIGADAAASQANLKLAIEDYNGTGSDEGTKYVFVGRKNGFRQSKRAYTCTVADDFIIAGFGDVAVSETLTAGSGVTAGTQSLWFGMRGATDLVVQLPGSPEFTRAEKRHGTYAKGLGLYGAKTFEDGAMALVNASHTITGWS